MGNQGTLDPNEEFLRHACHYEKNTSEFKNDIPSLSGFLKQGDGPLTRQEAAFLLWHHALSSDSAREECITNAGVAQACMSVIENKDALQVDRSCAAGILAALSLHLELRLELVKVRQGGKLLVECIFGSLHPDADSITDECKVHLATLLHRLCQDMWARAYIMTQLEQTLPWNTVARHLGAGAKRRLKMSLASEIAGFVACCIHGRDDLKYQAGKAGLVPLLLSMIASVKENRHLESASRCLLRVLEEDENWAECRAVGGLRTILDALGAPSRDFMQLEFLTYVQPKLEAQMAANAKAAVEAQAPPVPKTPSGNGDDGEGEKAEEPPAPEKEVSKSSLAQAEEARNLTPMDQQTGASQDKHVRIATPPLPEIMEPEYHLLRDSTVHLGWEGGRGLAARAHLAGCVYALCARADFCAEASTLQAVWRLAPLVCEALAAGDDGDGGKKKKKKKKKKKSVALTPEQEAALVAATGALKYLSSHNIDRYRIAKLGLLPRLITLASDCSKLLIRRNAHTILSNCGLLGENGPAMAEAKMPSEYHVTVPMSLTDPELLQLNSEFKDAYLVYEEQCAAREKIRHGGEIPRGFNPAGGRSFAGISDAKPGPMSVEAANALVNPPRKQSNDEPMRSTNAVLSKLGL